MSRGTEYDAPAFILRMSRSDRKKLESVAKDRNTSLVECLRVLIRQEWDRS